MSAYVDLAVHDTVVAHTFRQRRWIDSRSHSSLRGRVRAVVSCCLSHYADGFSSWFFSIIIKPASVSSGTTRYQSRVPLSSAHTHTHVESLNDWGGWWRAIYLVLLLVLVWTRRMRRGRGGVTTSYAKHIHVIQSSIHWKCSHKVEMLMVLLLYVPATAVVAREKYSFASFEIFFSFFFANNCFVVWLTLKATTTTTARATTIQWHRHDSITDVRFSVSILFMNAFGCCAAAVTASHTCCWDCSFFSVHILLPLNKVRLSSVNL